MATDKKLQRWSDKLGRSIDSSITDDGDRVNVDRPLKGRGVGWKLRKLAQSSRLTANDHTCVVDLDVAGANTQYLPKGEDRFDGQEIVLQDGKGDCETNPITVDGGDMPIEGSFTYRHATNGGQVTFRFSSSEGEWKIVNVADRGVITLSNYTALRAVTGSVSGSRKPGTAVLKGRTTANDGGGGTFFWEVGAATDDDGVVIVPTNPSAGGFWRRGNVKYSNPFWWGADPSGTINSQPAIQAATDYALYKASNRCPVILPPGRFRLDSTWHVGYGVTYLGQSLKSALIEGAGCSLRGESGMPGTTVFTTFSDAPGIAFQGIFGGEFRGIALRGSEDQISWHVTNLFAFNEFAPLIDDTVAANWIAPTLSATADSRYAPFAGVAIDPYSGPQPATAYPTVSYPAFLGAVAQYNKAQSSQIRLCDVFIGGFATGLAIQPCDYDGNGDFISLKDSQIEFCKYGISVGNSQSRNVNIEDCQISRVHTCFTNNKNGKQIGKFGGTVKNLAVFGVMQLCDFNVYAGPMTLSGHAENCWRIGDIEAPSPWMINFSAFDFCFSNQQDTRGYPAYVLGGSVGGHSNVSFSNCTFTNSGPAEVLGFQHRSRFDNCRVYIDARTQLFEKFAHNALSGGIVPAFFLPSHTDFLVQYYNLNSGSVVTSNAATENWAVGDRQHCIPLAARNVIAGSEEYTDRMRNPVTKTNLISKETGLTSCTLVNKTLTIVFASRSDYVFAQNGPLPGDVLWDDLTGTTFFVRSRIGNTVLATIKNNFKSNGVGGFVPLVAFSGTTGNFYCLNSRIYTPDYYLRGDCTAGSPEITSVARDDGYGNWTQSRISSGDYVLVESSRDAWTSPAESMITAVDETAATITLSGSSAMRTQDRRRLDFFIRSPAPNV